MKTLIYILLFCCAHYLLQAQPSQAWEQLLDGYAEDDVNYNLLLDEQNQQVIWSLPATYIDSSGTPTNEKNITAAFAASGQTNWIEWCDTHPINQYFPIQALSAPNGNIQVLGSFSSDTTGPNLFLLAYQPDGTPLWTNYYSTYLFYSDDFKALNDTEGNIYAAGLETPLPDLLPILAKFDAANGDTLWVSTLHNTNMQYKDAAIDTIGGFVYVLLYKGGAADYFQIVKCNFSGEVVSSWQYDTPEYSNDNIETMLCDRQGNLVLQTASGNTASTTLSRRLIKYNAAGQELWNVALPVTYLRMVADDDNDIILAQRVSGNLDSMSVRKYTPDGALLWETYLKGNVNAPSPVYFLQTDAHKRIYLGLFRAVSPSYKTNTLLCLSPEGEVQWSYILSESHKPIKMITDTSGAVYISGIKLWAGSSSNGDAFLHKVANLGTAVVPVAPPPSAVPALALHWSGSGQQLGIDLSNCANLSAKTVQIVDMYGRVCLSQSLPDYSSTASLDLPPLHAGLYVVVVSQAGQRIAQGRFFYAP
jgi:hypothetical protein